MNGWCMVEGEEGGREGVDNFSKECTIFFKTNMAIIVQKPKLCKG